MDEKLANLSEEKMENIFGHKAFNFSQNLLETAFASVWNAHAKSKIIDKEYEFLLMKNESANNTGLFLNFKRCNI